MKKLMLLSVAIVAILIIGSVSQAQALTLMESYNVADTWTNGTYYATQVALKYIPTISYNLGRVEFFTSGDKNNVTIALRPSVSDYPDTTILASGNYNSSGTGSWLGATFDSAYSVTAGSTYWITWYNTSGLSAPYSDGNNQIVRWGENNDINSYSNLYTSSGFKTKFYGTGENVIPEPATMSLLGMGLLGLMGLKKRRAIKG